MAYVTTDELRAYTKDTSVLDQAIYEDAIAAAEVEINGLCGRYFSQDATTSVQYFWPETPAECCVDDISTTTGLLVDVDFSGNGSYSQSWTLDTDFFLEPVNRNSGGIIGWPYTKLSATYSNKYFPLRHQYLYTRPTVRVTARWGWAAVPAQVKQATKIAATMLYKMSDAPFGVAGFDAFGAVRVRSNPEILNLLRPFLSDEYAVA